MPHDHYSATPRTLQQNYALGGAVRPSSKIEIDRGGWTGLGLFSGLVGGRETRVEEESNLVI